MSSFDPKANQGVGLQGLLSQKDLDTVLGTNNDRGSAMRPPVHKIPSDSITKFQQVIGSEIGCDGSIKITLSRHGVEVEIDIDHKNLVVYGQPEG